MGSNASRPIIGLTTYLQQARTGVWDVRASFLPAIYLDGVTRAGGIASLLPPQPVDDAIVDRMLDGLDGLVLTGGRDVDPASYGQAAHPITDEPAGDRDALEFALLRGALARGLPVLGICRGAQVLNVALGGTLHQHLPDVLGHTKHQAGNAVFSTSGIRTVPGTRLAALIGESSDAQCYHHQAIDRLGDGLDRVGAGRGRRRHRSRRDRPGKYPDSWVLAVQWHPEERLDDLRLFAGVVEAATGVCDRKGSGAGGPPLAGESEATGKGFGEATSTLINPATEQVIRTVEQVDVAGVDDAVARAVAAQKRWARIAPAERAAALRAFAAVVGAHVDELAALEVANSGHPIGNAEWEAGHVRDVLQFYSASPERLGGQADSRRRRARRHVQRAARRGRRHRAVELPDDDRVVGVRACARGGQRSAGQARRVDPADHDPARRIGRRVGAARRAVPGAAGQGLGGRRAVRHASRRAQDRVHRLDRGGDAGDGGRGRPGEAGDAGTRRQERQHRVRRLRPGEGRGDGAVRRVRQRRAGLLCAQPDPGAAQRLRPFHGAARAGRQGCGGRRSHRPRHRDGPAGVASRTGSPSSSYVPDGCARRLPRVGTRRARDTGSRRRCSPRSAPIAP